MADVGTSIKINSRFSPAYDLQAKINVKLGKFETAMANLNMAIKLDPANYDAFYTRGFLKQIMARTLEAEKDFNSAMALDPRFKVSY